MAFNPNSYDQDIVSLSYNEIAQNAAYIFTDNPDFLKGIEENAGSIQEGGLKNSRLYRQIFMRKYLEGATPIQRAAFLMIVSISAFVQTSRRVKMAIKTIRNANLRQAMTMIAGDFRDKRSAQDVRNGADDLNTFMVQNLRSAFPEIILMTRVIVMGTARMMNFVEPTVAEAPPNTTINAGVPAFTGTAHNLQEYLVHPNIGQLFWSPNVKALYRSIAVDYWVHKVKGVGSGWKEGSDAWWNTTTNSDGYLLPTVMGVVPARTGPAVGGSATYTMADVVNWANGIQAAVSAAPALAPGSSFAGAQRAYNRMQVAILLVFLLVQTQVLVLDMLSPSWFQLIQMRKATVIWSLKLMCKGQKRLQLMLVWQKKPDTRMVILVSWKCLRNLQTETHRVVLSMYVLNKEPHEYMGASPFGTPYPT